MTHDAWDIPICQVLKLRTTLAIRGYCLHTLVGSCNLKLSKDGRMMNYPELSTCDMSHMSQKSIISISAVYAVSMCTGLSTSFYPGLTIHSCFLQAAMATSRWTDLSQWHRDFETSLNIIRWITISIRFPVISWNCAASANLNCSPALWKQSAQRQSHHITSLRPQSPPFPAFRVPSSELIANFTASMRLELSIACPVRSVSWDMRWYEMCWDLNSDCGGKSISGERLQRAALTKLTKLSVDVISLWSC